MKRPASIIILHPLAWMAAFAMLSCSTPAQMLPADFAVTSLKTNPSQAAAGQEVQVTAEVINVGGMPGNFNSPLLLNGVKADTKVVTIQPNATKIITYSVSANKPGAYVLALGNTTAKFSIRATTERDVELKYDSGISRDSLWSGPGGGYLVDFTPAVKPFTLKKVSICGGIYGTAWEGKSIELWILGKDMKSTLYHEVYAVSKFPVKGTFPYQPPSWVDFDIPPMEINDTFYVFLFTGTGKHKGVQIGVDDSVLNEHSNLGQGKPPNITRVTMVSVYLGGVWYSDESKVNWMIRASGTSVVPAD
jgi:hypothetical protein